MINKGKQITDKVMRYATKEAERYMAKYVPFRDGTLRATAEQGRYFVEYIQPYARYMYYGISSSGNPLNYKTPGTGSYWDKKMMTAEGDDFIKQIQNYVRKL